ncbi:hypothetical protein SPRG_18066 [Saprolegnia parasitica CBS 223.65]|uniref:Uncharacterized protein n=1 Tax=Saprolegnia parasitica (strain CBS 223.65) TaxID=695850 RepID=A0A067BI47_SAPPC|nr:hypothetical protein SPRG_18066 [Saprolegnia parasitica CBS 223.65]KDO16410.1 hypothetical protein SPRG_18066 [Saprolegnia parasitica CBS 223.65]|eukprot:XP_012212884.1 hypothetical protein SPRG_18066 [Saprolegnia parasitica CBS 223.65]
MKELEIASIYVCNLFVTSRSRETPFTESGERRKPAGRIGFHLPTSSIQTKICSSVEFACLPELCEQE